MPVLETKLDTKDEAFQRNRRDMLEALGQIQALLDEAAQGGGPEARARLAARGKMPIRERISAVLDRDSPFLEISPLAAWRSDYTVGSGFVVGIGVIEGVECVILGHDPSVRAGAFNPFNMKKLMRGLQIARQNRMPYVQFVESAGADLRGEAGEDPEAATRRELDHFAESGRLFYEITELSKLRIPTISLVFGASTAGGAYQPGMSDYNIFVRKQSRVFLGGPPLVKMATGEDADEESLGGGDMHTRVSGLGDYLARDELDGIRMCREVVAHLNWRKWGPEPNPEFKPPKHDPEELLGVVAKDLRVPFDMREVIARIVDASYFEEFKPLYGPHPSVRLGQDSRLSLGGAGQQRRPVLGVLPKGRPVHSTVQPDRRAPAVPAQHHRLHRRHGLRAGRHHQGRLQDDQRGVQFHGAAHSPSLPAPPTAPATTA